MPRITVRYGPTAYAALAARRPTEAERLALEERVAAALAAAAPLEAGGHAPIILAALAAEQRRLDGRT